MIERCTSQSLIHPDPHGASRFSRLIPPTAESHDAQRMLDTPPLGNSLLSALSIENRFGLKKNRVRDECPFRWDVRYARTQSNLSFAVSSFVLMSVANDRPSSLGFHSRPSSYCALNNFLAFFRLLYNNFVKTNRHI